MPGGIRDIKRRIKSVQSTQKITKAMKMVSAAKLRKVQGKVATARPYASKLEDILSRLVESLDGYDNPLVNPPETEKKKVAFVVFSGDRGLCGGYNTNIIRLTESSIKKLKEGEEAALITIGKNGRDYFKRRNYNIIRDYMDLGDEPNYIQARELIKELVQLFTSGEVQEIRLVYTKFYSVIRHEPTVEKLLPLSDISNNLDTEKIDNDEGIEYIYEPNQAYVFDELLPRFMETLMYKALIEAKTSEHGARMTAMESASDNAAEIIHKLVLSFNRARQAAITNEITEIVSGAAALD